MESLDGICIFSHYIKYDKAGFMSLLGEKATHFFF